jgi:predicted molibdopterin-dependent oxidoreductase YjgC
MRISCHSILETQNKEEVRIKVDGKSVSALKGEPILAAFLANGIKITGYTKHRGEPRGLFCGIGRCTDCIVMVDGVPNVRSCVTPVEDGMTITTIKGEGYVRS